MKETLKEKIIEEFSDQFFVATEGRNDKRRARILKALSRQKKDFKRAVEGMSETIHTPVGGISNIKWIEKSDLLKKIEDL